MAPPTAIKSPKWLSGAPATKNSVLAARKMIIVVPISGSAMISPPTIPSSSTNGTNPSENLWMSFPRLASHAAM